jgi:universal stress protein A
MGKFNKVLVAIDGTGESERILQKALDLVSGLDAVISVVVVFEDLVHHYTYELNMGDFEKVQQEFQEALSSEVKNMLAAKFPAIAADAVHFLRGRAAGDEIKRFAKDTNADLVVVGSHGQGAIKSAILGSTANAVLHGIHCDVYTVRV